MDSICIGGGPAGLTAAYALAKAGRSVEVLEKDGRYVGGISRTEHQNGFYFDIGGHRFFSKSQEIVDLWKEILGDDLLVRRRKSRIYYQGKFYPYPLNAYQTLLNLGIIESLLCMLSYARARLFPRRNPTTFEEWITNQFGERLFNMFFKTYTEKVWGIPCNEISADWAAQRIKGLSLFNLVRHALIGNVSFARGRDTVKTLIESFHYPRKGPGMMWEAAARKITEMHGKISMGCEVTKLEYNADMQRWNITCGDVTRSAKHVISSMPLRELIAALGDVPADVKQAADQLQYRDFITVALTLHDRHAFDDNWLYIHDPDVRVGRIQNFKSWSPDMVQDKNYTCYGMEYFCFENDTQWNMSDEDLIALATRELIAIHLASPGDVTGGYVVRQPKAYPIYDKDYQQHVNVIRQWLDSACPGLQIVGRNGMHKYNNQDHSMMTALLATRNILAGEVVYNLWAVNQDAQYHEGSAGSSGERLVPKRA